VHLVEDQAGGSPRRDQDHLDIDPITGTGGAARTRYHLVRAAAKVASRWTAR
jgi:hypothetical protein